MMKQMRHSGPNPMESMKAPTMRLFRNMNIHSSIDGYRMSCMISVPIRKEQGPYDKLKPIICTNMRMPVRECIDGTNVYMNPIKRRLIAMTLMPYIMKFLLPYFYRSCPEMRVTTTCSRLSKTKEWRTSSLSPSPPMEGNTTLPPNVAKAAPPDNWLKKMIPAAMYSLFLYGQPTGSQNDAFSDQMSQSGSLFISLNSARVTSSYIRSRQCWSLTSSWFSIMLYTVQYGQVFYTVLSLMRQGKMGTATIILQARSPSMSSTTKLPTQKPMNIPIVMNNWLRVPAGPPIDPGSTDVRQVGIIMVLIPTANPNSTLLTNCTPQERLMTPMRDATMVRQSVNLNVQQNPQAFIRKRQSETPKHYQWQYQIQQLEQECCQAVANPFVLNIRSSIVSINW